MRENTVIHAGRFGSPARPYADDLTVSVPRARLTGAAVQPHEPTVCVPTGVPAAAAPEGVTVGVPRAPEGVTVSVPRAPAVPEGVTVCVPGSVLAPAPAAEAPPVFVDDSGRRRLVIRVAGYLVALLCLGFLGLVGVALAAPTVATAVGLDGAVPFLVPDAAAPPPPPPPPGFKPKPVAVTERLALTTTAKPVATTTVKPVPATSTPPTSTPPTSTPPPSTPPTSAPPSSAPAEPASGEPAPVAENG